MHGRTLPVATGIKLANPTLTVIAAGGDGDGYGIGLNHVLHAIRRNVNLTYIVMDNGVYGNTKGQTAPNSPRGYVSPSSPYGSTDDPIAILPIALGAGISFLAQGIASDVPGLTDMIRRAIEHPGFALVNAISPCVTYDKVHTYPWYKERIYSLEKAGHLTHDRQAAFSVVCETDGRIPIGVIYEDVHSEDLTTRLSRFTQPAAGIELDDTLRNRYESLMEEWV
jgi:2-oxoglutarate ferredoxin oxidoreductase subunit beta